MRWPEPAIGADEVHVWWFSLDQPASVRTDLERCLSDDERARMQRLVFVRHRQRFGVARGSLRHLLGAYCLIDPAVLRFQYTRFGKPCLGSSADGETSSLLTFNLSHSADVAVCAIAVGRAIGVDVEAIGTLSEATDLLCREAAPAERAAYWSLPAARRAEAFGHWWVRKEAYVKAVGTGLLQPLRDFVVSISPDEPARLLAVAHDPVEAGRWSLRQLAAPAGYAACVAVEGSDCRVIERQVEQPIPNYVPRLRLPSEVRLRQSA